MMAPTDAVDPQLLGVLVAIVLTAIAVTILDYREHCRKLDALKPYRPEKPPAKAEVTE